MTVTHAPSSLILIMLHFESVPVNLSRVGDGRTAFKVVVIRIESLCLWYSSSLACLCQRLRKGTLWYESDLEATLSDA